MLGTREPAKLADFRKEVPGAKVGSFADAAAHGEVVVLAVLGSAAEQVVDAAGPGHLDGKVLIDTTNPLDYSRGMPPGTFLGLDDSLAERVQRKAPRAKVVKAFNTVPNPKMLNPPSGARMLIAGNDAGAKKRVEALLREHGWAGAIDLGGVQEARWMEAFVPLWVRAGVAIGRWDHIFDVR
jgi:predicted dinucleotide-binding enzyme